MKIIENSGDGQDNAGVKIITNDGERQETAPPVAKSYLYFWNLSVTLPAASTTYYHSAFEFSTSDSRNKIYVPTAITVTDVSIAIFSGTASSAEAVTTYLRVAGVDNLINNTLIWNTAGGYNNVLCSGLNIAIAAGSYFNIKIVTPAWTTAPTNCRFFYTIAFKN